MQDDASMAARKVEGNILAHIQSGGSLFEKLKNLEERAGQSQAVSWWGD